MSVGVEELTARIERLESSNRLLQRLVLTAVGLGLVLAMFAVGLGLVLAMFAAQRALAAPAVGPVSASEFILTDDQGKARGYFGFDNNGAPMLALYGTIPVESPLALLEAKPDGTVSLTLGRAGTHGNFLANATPTGALLALNQGNVQSGVLMYSGSTGVGAAQLYDGSGNVTWSAP